MWVILSQCFPEKLGSLSCRLMREQSGCGVAAGKDKAVGTFPHRFPPQYIMLEGQRSPGKISLPDNLAGGIPFIVVSFPGGGSDRAEERELQDKLMLKFEAVNQMDKEEQCSMTAVLDALILKHQVKRLIR
ncbi:transcriptional regulator [Xenorhabdus mauleonii]|uniref:Transcriptional regulator n=2 Tax=Xenorhabdus mauleonii TaxID=351675 RepID=A0A2G0N975_9GAMM|nr:transcriptional regulator [Xenorhabdus mauleonii]